MMTDASPTRRMSHHRIAPWVVLLTLAVPACALTSEELAGTWQGDGAATWAELAQDPQYLPTNPKRMALVRAHLVAAYAQVQCVFAAQAALIGTTPADSVGLGERLTMPGAAVVVGAGGVPAARIWTSQGADVATLVETDPDGRVRTSRIERVDAQTLRVTKTKPGDRVMTIVFHRASAATSAP